MAEKRKNRKRKTETVDDEDPLLASGVHGKPTKDHYKLADWMRSNVPIKRTKFLNHNVEYFTGQRAVDIIFESKWSTGDKAKFRSRDEILEYLHSMLLHKFYHRARKIVVEPEERKSKKRQQQQPTPTITTATATNTEETNLAKDGTAATPPEEEQELKVQRKRKIRLDMHNDQRFVDSLDAYVWIYDPIPFYYWIFGALLVLGAIGICLFPLWPSTVRLGVYYLSVAAAGFLVAIILLVILRVLLFCLIWALTIGRHHLWILPNLTEDVGFFASFWPLYNYEYKGRNSTSKKSNSNNKSKKQRSNKIKEKCSDAENDDEEGSVKNLGAAEKRQAIEVEDESVGTSEGATEAHQSSTDSNQSESESESSSQQSSNSATGKDFEMLEHPGEGVTPVDA